MLVYQNFGADAATATTLPPPQNQPAPAPAPMQPSRDERIAKTRKRVLVYGLASAISSGGAVTGVSAGAFGLARTERVWTPALYLGGITLLTGLARMIAMYRFVPEYVDAMDQADMFGLAYAR